MNARIVTVSMVIALGLLVFTGCAKKNPNPGSATATPEPSIANPATANCELKGYRSKIRTTTDGSQYGVCIFPDGSACEEWAFYRGECAPVPVAATPSTDGSQIANPASVNCEQKGGKLEIRTASGGGQYGVCTFPDGSECEEWAYLRGECTPGSSTPSK